MHYIVSKNYMNYMSIEYYSIVYYIHGIFYSVE